MMEQQVMKLWARLKCPWWAVWTWWWIPSYIDEEYNGHGGLWITDYITHYYTWLKIWAVSEHALIHCAILRPWGKVPWTAPSISPSSCHNSCTGIIPHNSLLLSGHNVHMNLIVIKCMVTSVIDKHFGLVDTGQSWLDGNKTPSPAAMVLLFLGPIAATVFLHRLKIYLILLLNMDFFTFTQIWKSDIYSVACIM